MGMINESYDDYTELKQPMPSFKEIREIMESLNNHYQCTDATIMRYLNTIVPHLIKSETMNQAWMQVIKGTNVKIHHQLHHAKRVSKLCESIAYAMICDTATVEQIKIAGFVHDIGKLRISKNILHKRGKLTHQEWGEIQCHPETGYFLLKKSKEFASHAKYVAEHHERWEGSGYPNRLKGEKISIQARIISVADSFDAMTNDRTYRNGLSIDEGVREITRNAGTQFDPHIVQIFIETVMGKGYSTASFRPEMA